MANVYIPQVSGGEQTSLSETDTIEIDTGSASKYARISTLRNYILNYITSLTAKTSLVDADELPMSDSAASNVAKKITWANIMVAILAYTGTFTNKRITKRVSSTTDSATATINSDSYDEYYLTAIANNTTISITGTPTTGQTLFVGLKDAGTSKTLTWSGITALGVTLPTATTINKQHIIGIKYISSTWYAIAVSVQA